MKPRDLAVNILLRMNQQDGYSTELLKNEDVKKLDPRDENLVRELVYGVTGNQLYLDAIIMKLSKTSFKKMDLTIIQILRLALYQLIFMDRIPDHAILFESGQLVKNHSYPRYVSFVNGVLRNFQRHKLQLIKMEFASNSERLSIQYSHNREIVDLLLSEYGGEFTEEILKHNNQRPPLCIRCNTLKIFPQDLEVMFQNKNIAYSSLEGFGDGYCIHHPIRIDQWEEFTNGYFTIQDPGSMMVARVVEPPEHSKILDLCAAPGGKSMHMAALMNNTGHIVANDIYEHKLFKIMDNCQRLGVVNLETSQYDASHPIPAFEGKFDYVLVDAPCSGLGIIRRKPEIKIKRTMEDIENCAALQRRILDCSVDYLKPGGFLVYSTCSISQMENEDNVHYLLDKFPAIQPVNLSIHQDCKGNSLKLLTPIHHTDGFFIARFQKC